MLQDGTEMSYFYNGARYKEVFLATNGLLELQNFFHNQFQI